MKITRNFKRSIAVIADTHIGSPYGIASPEMRDNGAQIKMTRHQKILYSYWHTIQATCNDLKVDTVLLNGDLIHGRNRKENGAGCIGSLSDQVTAATQLLAPLCHNRKVFGVEGTIYHHSIDTDTEQIIVESLGGKYAGRMLDATIDGTSIRLNMCHGKSTGGYKETSIAKDINAAKIAAYDDKVDRYDLFIRSHSHTFCHVDKPGIHYVSTPSFTFLPPSDYSMKGWFQWQSCLGCVIILIDDANRIQVLHFLLDNYPRVLDHIRL